MSSAMLTEYRVAVTGGAGFIGSHIVDKLAKEGAEVLVIDNMSTGQKANIEDAISQGHVKLVQQDIIEPTALSNLIRSFEPEAILHLAAKISVQDSVRNPLDVNNVNVDGTLHVLESARKSDVDKIVMASSSAVYGDLPSLPKREDLPVLPLSPYGASKLAAETYVQTYFRVYGLNTIVLRFFNVFGPRQSYSMYGGVITVFISHLINRQPITIFGDGEQTRDFIYVKDVVQANILALCSDKGAGDVFNIASGTPTSINQLYQLVSKIIGLDQPVNYRKARKGDIRHSFADVNQAKRVLNWTPFFSLRNGLKETVEWYRQNSNSVFR
ncbi:MAG: SDR family oxidoreductase [Candidatus Ranarchaeia archaeon]